MQSTVTLDNQDETWHVRDGDESRKILNWYEDAQHHDITISNQQSFTPRRVQLHCYLTKKTGLPKLRIN